MVSILGESSYTFPDPFPLRYALKDFIERKVDERYYLSDELVKEFERYAEKEGKKDGNPN